MRHRRRVGVWRLALVIAVIVLGLDAAPAAGQQTVTVTIPPAVSFGITDISAATPGAPSDFTVSFTNASGLTGGQRLNISVRADAATFSPLNGGVGIPADAVSWTVTATQRGTGSHGTLSALAYGQVFRASNNSGSGSVSLGWTLAPLAASGLRAGPQTLTIRWRVEAF